MNISEPIFGVASALLLAASGPSYFISTIKGQMKPQRATWFIWAVLGVTALVSQVALGGTWSVVFTAVDSLGNILMFLLALKYGVGGWNRLDKIALVIAGVGIIVSIVVRQQLIALVGVIVADAASASLTIRKAYLDPASEDPLAWLLVGLSAVCALIAVGRIDVQLLIYPIYLALANFGVVVAQRVGFRRVAGRV
ncbi:hypothetical protein HJC99_02550 [Candidatus Saccharibacteria bacterium]|nr:hypothetical protein [Candidatus Saccharibacteria bacterium]